MSFAAKVREELSRQTARTKHCRTAELAALLFFSGTLQIDEKGQMRLVFRTEQAAAQETFLQLLKRLFHITEEQFTQEIKERKNGMLCTIRLEDQDLVRQILTAAGTLDSQGELSEERPLSGMKILEKECCRRAFLRGAFLAAGTISDPNRSYHLEFLCNSEEQREQLRQLLDSVGIQAGTVRRGIKDLVYLKDGSRIADMLSLMEAHVSLLNFENARIMREVRGNINRKVNCETANIRKTADASAGQIEDVKLIQKTIGFSALPKILDETARIRLQYPTATLQELGDLHEPPVGKSGINHRMRKLHAIAEQLKKE